MAEPTRDELLALLYADYIDAFASNADVLNYSILARGSVAGGRWTEAIGHLVSTVEYIYETLNSLIGVRVAYPYELLPVFLDLFTGAKPPDIDMSAILDAMYKAEPHQPILFVGYLEAYYASVWNASFDEHTFAELVKRWAIWG